MVGMEQQSGSLEDPAAKLVLGQYDAPAYIRRARNVESDLDELFIRCNSLRRQWLNQPERIYHELKAKAGQWDRLEKWVSRPEQFAYLLRLEGLLQPVLKYPPPVSRWFWGVGKSIEQLRLQIRQFNQAWEKHLKELDLNPLNRSREGYNRWYILEKECAMGSSALAGRGFEKLEPITHAELLAQFPLLPESGHERP